MAPEIEFRRPLFALAEDISRDKIALAACRKTDHRSKRWQGAWDRPRRGLVRQAWPAHRSPAGASSHMDAPAHNARPPRPTPPTSMRSLSAANGTEYLTTALAVFPFEEPGIGPNTFRLRRPGVAYDIHVSLDNDVGKGKTDPDLPVSASRRHMRVPRRLLSYLGTVAPKQHPQAYRSPLIKTSARPIPLR